MKDFRSVDVWKKSHSIPSKSRELPGNSPSYSAMLRSRLQGERWVSVERVVWAHEPGPPRIVVDSGQHRRGLWAG